MTSSTLPPRTVTLVLVHGDGRLVGALPPFEVGSPWWPDVGPVVQVARERFGVELTVLRLLEAPDSWPGGRVTYLAEVADSELPADIELMPWRGALDDHPLRLAWARPGGPAADIAWARRALTRAHLHPSEPAEQVRTWNLSSLWRLPLAEGTAWFKSVPPFFEHEGRILERLAGAHVPHLIAHEGRRMLMRDVPGEDLHGPSPEQLEVMVDRLVDLQARWIGRTDELLGLGLADWRSPALVLAVRDVIARRAGVLDRVERRRLARFAAGLEARLAEVARYGVPDTLVHGDFHPGNHRGSGTEIVLLDWGDSGVGQPLLDQPAFLQRVPESQVEPLRRRWEARWRSALPGSDPQRAARLLAPVAASRQAVIYQKFLDNIEPSEHPYHRDDPAAWLRRTAQLIGLEE